MDDEQQPSSSSAGPALPTVGEVRTAGTETRQWDGHAWRMVPRTFLGTEDFTGRMKAYAKPLLGTMASDLASPVLHPIDTASRLVDTVLHPIDTASSLYQTGKSAVLGDPNAMGHVLAMAATPQVADASLTGVNQAAHALAENPAVRSGLGYVGGAGTALVTGMGHPFIGGAVGRIASPLLKGPATDVAAFTDRLRELIHGTPETSTTGAAPLSPADQALFDQIQAKNAQIAAREAAAKQARTAASSASPSSSTLATTPTAFDQVREGKGAPPDSSPVPRADPATAAYDRIRAQQGASAEPPLSARGTAKPAFTAQDATIYQAVKSGQPIDLTNANVQVALQKLRDSYGAERAANMLGQSGPDVIRKAAPGPSQLPTAVRARIATDVAALKSPVEARAYLARAKDAKAIAYIQGLYQKFGISTGE